MHRYLEWITSRPRLVIGLTVVLTLFLGSRLSDLKVIIDMNTMVPQSHPFVSASLDVERIFGVEETVVIAITARQGDVFQPHVLAKVQRITNAVADLPGSISNNILSLAARKAKAVTGTPDGMEVQPLLDGIPQAPAEIEATRRRLGEMPVYDNAILSPDHRTTAVIAQFKSPKGSSDFQTLLAQVTPIVDRERDASVEIFVGGQPTFLALLEQYAQRIAVLFVLAVIITGLIHYEAFRTAQGLVLPLVTALVAVLWGLGAMSLAHVPMDVFNSTTPILILAVAAGHAVQILKRYYEEYGRLLAQGAPPSRETNRIAVVAALTQIAPVMLTAGFVAALGFLSLLVFDLQSIQTFGIFTAIGIISALVLELTFIPALRTLLAPPKPREQARERGHRVWDRITAALADAVLTRRRVIYAAFTVLVVVSGTGMTRIRNDNDVRNYFFRGLEVQRHDQEINERLGGTNSLYVLVEGAAPDAIKDPRVLRAMDATQQFLNAQPYVGKTISMADFVKRMNRAMHVDDPAFDRIPDDRDTVSQYLLVYSMAGEPGDFDSYVDYEYKTATVLALLKTDSTAYFDTLVAELTPFLREQFGDLARVRVGGSVSRAAAVNEVMVDGKLRNIGQFALVLFVLTALVCRSVIASFLVLTPLAITVVVNFGLLGVTGIPLNIMNAITTAMGVGVGADYAIYLIYRLREELQTGGDDVAVFRRVFGSAGKAVLFVASAVAGGYGVLVFSWGFYMHIWMGILIASAMLVSAFSALLLMPSLILTLRPRFLYRGAGVRLAPRGMTAALCIAAVAAPVSVRTQSLSAIEVMERSFMVSKFAGSTQQLTLELTNSRGQTRIRNTFSATKLQANGVDAMRVVRFLSPSDVRGTATLLVEHSAGDDDIWIYLPGLRKVRRLVASNKKDSFVGTDFSYGDVIGHKVTDWHHRALAEDTVDGQACYVIESTPATDTVTAQSGYAKRQSWIRKDNFVLVKAEIWDRSGQLLKTLRYADVQEVDPAEHKWLAMRAEARNAQTGHSTVVRIENFRLDRLISNDIFTPRYLEREP